jgi:F0F1-type ATP synthase membrane subunit c/vacuolar-type H+-ATPase subunit K
MSARIAEFAALRGFPGVWCRGTVPSVQASPGRQNRWWISPAIPTIANVALAVLWAFSAFGGWGAAAFCGDDAVSADCAAGVSLAAGVSAVPAALAAALALGSWMSTGVRRDPDRLDSLLSLAAIGWVVAEAILFIGGYMAKP